MKADKAADRTQYRIDSEKLFTLDGLQEQLKSRLIAEDSYAVFDILAPHPTKSGLRIIGSLRATQANLPNLETLIQSKKREYYNQRSRPKRQRGSFEIVKVLRHNAPIRDIENITSANGKTLKLVTTSLTNFTQDVLVLLDPKPFGYYPSSAGLDWLAPEKLEEVFELDPTLRDLYKNMCDIHLKAPYGVILDPNSKYLIQLSNLQIAFLGQHTGLDQLNFLNYILSQTFKHGEEGIPTVVENAEDIDKIIPAQGGEYGTEECKLVPMDAFLKGNAGVCKEYALYSCYLINRLMQRKLIDCVEVHYAHAFITREGKGTGHAWVMLKNAQNEWIHFDPAQNVIKTLNPDSYIELCEHYGQEAMDSALQKLYIDPVEFQNNSPTICR